MDFSSEVFNGWGDKYQVTEFRITLSQKLRSWCERLVLHEKNDVLEKDIIAAFFL